jgi:hypothetical protein
MDDFWSQQEGDIQDYAPRAGEPGLLGTGNAGGGGGGGGGGAMATAGREGSALLQAAKGEPLLVIRLTEGIDECAP